MCYIVSHTYVYFSLGSCGLRFLEKNPFRAILRTVVPPLNHSSIRGFVTFPKSGLTDGGRIRRAMCFSPKPDQARACGSVKRHLALLRVTLCGEGGEKVPRH